MASKKIVATAELDDNQGKAFKEFMRALLNKNIPIFKSQVVRWGVMKAVKEGMDRLEDDTDSLVAEIEEASSWFEEQTKKGSLKPGFNPFIKKARKEKKNDQAQS